MFKALKLHFEERGNLGKFIYRASCINYAFGSTFVMPKITRYDYGACSYLYVYIKNARNKFEMKKLWIFEVELEVGGFILRRA